MHTVLRAEYRIDDDPHGDSTWPHSRRALAESPLALHGSEVLRKVTCENAARVYGFQV